MSKLMTHSNRRTFLRQSAVVTAGTVAVTATATVQSRSSAEPDINSKSTQRKGYQLTQHVLDYYKTAAL